PRSASWIEEMEERSHRRIRDLDVLTAFQGLVANEIGCGRISMMAREQKRSLQWAEYRCARPIISRSSHPACTAHGAETLPAMARLQMRETNYLQIVTSGLHRTAGPYRSTWSSEADRPLRDGAPSCVIMRRTSRPWTSSLPRPLASTCSMSSSSFDCPP